MAVVSFRCPRCGASIDPKQPKCPYCGGYYVVRDGTARGVLDLSYIDEKYLVKLSERLEELLNSAMGMGGFSLYTRTPRKVLQAIEKTIHIVNLQLRKDPQTGLRYSTVPVAVSISEVLYLLEPMTKWDNELGDRAIKMDPAIMERLEDIVMDLSEYLEELLEKEPQKPQIKESEAYTETRKKHLPLRTFKSIGVFALMLAVGFVVFNHAYLWQYTVPPNFQPEGKWIIIVTFDLLVILACTFAVVKSYREERAQRPQTDNDQQQPTL
jgi:predicted RNA-binding Zn-ribbon protein involved in translation (DUF1610 family)